MSNSLEGMINNLAKQKPEEAQKMRDRIKVDEIIDRLIPLYDQHFTADDLQAYIDFYSSPKGKKLLTEIPSLMKESVGVSAKYFTEKFPEITKK
jgi:hypothetical protein